jgi:hypothetical protein
MTLDDFNALDEQKQASSIMDRGVFLAYRLYKEFKIFLYQIDDFYVEVYYNNRYNLVQGFGSFEYSSSLDPYLRNIQIPEFH